MTIEATNKTSRQEAQEEKKDKKRAEITAVKATGKLWLEHSKMPHA